jgi:cold shock CspA family protein
MNSIHSGTVTGFDDQRGTGEITADSGSVLPFHCTAIADGSRTVTVGSSVRFNRAAGHGGRWEARHIVVTASSAVANSESSFPCPVCAASIDGAPRNYEICDRCGWEDDPLQFDDPTYAGGANSESLFDARSAWVTGH